MGKTNRASRDQYREMERLCGVTTDKYLSDEEAVLFVADLWKAVRRAEEKARKKAIEKGMPQRYTSQGLPKTPPVVRFRGYRQSGISFKGQVQLSHTPSLYLIIHEIAHEVHGHIRALVPKKDNKHYANHHGPDYLANLLFLNEFVLKRKAFQKYLEAEVKPLRENPKAKKAQAPLVTLLKGGYYSVKLLPNVQDAMQMYIFDNDCEGKWTWLSDKINDEMEKNTIKVTLQELVDINREMIWVEGYYDTHPEDRRIYRKIVKLTDAITEAMKLAKKALELLKQEINQGEK